MTHLSLNLHQFLLLCLVALLQLKLQKSLMKFRPIAFVPKHPPFHYIYLLLSVQFQSNVEVFKAFCILLEAIMTSELAPSEIHCHWNQLKECSRRKSAEKNAAHGSNDFQKNKHVAGCERPSAGCN